MTTPATVTAPVTCATPQFQAIRRPNTVCKPTFDTIKGFWRAMKVFLASYPEFSPKGAVIYQNYFKQYINEMKSVYNTPNVNMASMVSVLQEIKAENYGIVICPKRLKVPDPTTAPVLVATVWGKKFSKNLNKDQIIQNYDPIKMSFSYQNFLKFRSDSSQKISITVQTNEWTQEGYQPNSFEFSLANINPEGFEDWVDFGRGVQVLIGIEYIVVDEKKITPEAISEFHFETIIRMLEKRLKEYNQKTQSLDLGHKVFAMKSKVTHSRPLIDPTTDQMFWLAPTREKHSKKVKFFELQMGYESAEDFEDNVCLCSEWCNWNAFFYYNPIYRFLLLRHTQLYMKNRTNVPEFYLCSAVIKACFRGTPGKTPLLLLMISANDYRKRYFDKYLMQNQKFKTEYPRALPAPQTLNALSYNGLRYILDITQQCLELNADPFSDLCIELMQNYFKILTDLHTFHSFNRFFVQIQDQKDWYIEMDSLSRRHYGTYIKRGYDLCISNNLGGYDYLFGVDYEYVDRIAQSTEAVYVKSIRDNVTKKIWTDNPLNFKVISNDFLNMFISVYKFLAKFEAKLPTAHRTEAKREIYQCYKRFDADCEHYLTNKTFNYRFEHMDIQNLPVFYTLKLYSYLFEIQRHSINSVLNYNKESFYEEQVSTSFNFIWRQILIEQIYRNLYPGETLFEISPEIDQTFNEFYELFWGRPSHETTPGISFIDCTNSALFQYQRLYFWNKNNGNQRKKFTKILEVFNHSFSDLFNRSEVILNQWISESIKDLSQIYEYFLEVFDYLVYYLVKADCSMILSTTATFFKQMHSLQTAYTVQNHCSFVLSKPGWVPLFRTLDSVLETIDKIKVNYIIFDDEFKRISNTCDQTKHMIKNIYRNFYIKLVDEWIEELIYIWDNAPRSYPTLTEFVLIHLAIGFAFHSHFVNHFRKHFFQYKKKLFLFLNETPDLNKNHQVQLFRSRNVLIDYLRDKNLIQEAQPFEASIWTIHLVALITKLDQMTAQQLNINMTDADT